jgi:hypothetical protein
MIIAVKRLCEYNADVPQGKSVYQVVIYNVLLVVQTYKAVLEGRQVNNSSES